MSNEIIEETKKSKINILKIILPILIAVLSFTLVAKVTTSPQFNKSTIEYLDVKRANAISLSAAAATTATTVSLILGDRGAPISTKLLDLTGYFLLILSAIILEKYLMTILGMASFRIILPLAALLYLLYVFLQKEVLKKLSYKLAIFSIVIFAVIPSSVMLSQLIEKIYKENEKIEQIVNSSNEIKYTDMPVVTETENNNISDNSIINQETEKTEGFFDVIKNASDNFVKGVGNIKDTASKIVGNITNSASEFIGNVKDKAKEIFSKATDLLGDLIEQIAIMIVTTCVMPILILFFFIWIVKMIFNVDIDTKKLNFFKGAYSKEK